MNRSKKILSIFGILMMSSAFAASQSFAAKCPEAEIELVGPNTAVLNSQTAMQIKCTGITTDWSAGSDSIAMQVHADVKDQVLATALTAKSLGKKVYIIATAGEGGGVITAMYLQ